MSLFRSAAARLFRHAKQLAIAPKQLAIAPQQRGIHHLQLVHESLEDLTHRLAGIKDLSLCRGYFCYNEIIFSCPPIK